MDTSDKIGKKYSFLKDIFNGLNLMLEKVLSVIQALLSNMQTNKYFSQANTIRSINNLNLPRVHRYISKEASQTRIFLSHLKKENTLTEKKFSCSAFDFSEP